MYYLGAIEKETGKAVVYRVREDGYCQDLDPRWDLHNHSPTGFQWGYGGSGPAQLALALLADHLNDDAQAQRFYQLFKWKVISQLEMDKGWTLSSEEIHTALARIREENR